MLSWINMAAQVLILAFLFYYVFLFFRGTRGVQILIGLILVLSVLISLTELAHFDALNWVVRRFSVFAAVAFLVIFQPEIRRALAELGRQPAFGPASDLRETVEHVVQAVTQLAEHRIGALVAIEREIGTLPIQETGVRLDARVAPELLTSLFFPHTPLHDGGVIISGNRIVAAGCVFPLSQKTTLHRTLGTRHRAAVGMTEETDAVAVVVSEETGTISVSYRGRLSRGLDADRLRRFLSALLLRGKLRESAWRRIQRRLDLTPDAIARTEGLDNKERSREA